MAYALQAPTVFTSSRYHGRPDYSPTHTVPRLYHHQPSPSDGSSNGSSPSGSELSQHHRSPMDQSGYPPVYEGYPVSTDQNSPYGHSHMQHSGLSQEFGTFRGQQTYQSVRIYLLYSTAYPQTMFDTSLIPLIGIASRFWHTTKSLLLLYPRIK